MRPGPAKRPASVEEALGRPGHRSINRSEPQPQPLKDANPPDHLDAVAKKEWKRVQPELSQLGLLTELDRTMLSIYCQAFSDFVRYSNIIKKSGEVYSTPTHQVKPVPHIHMRQHAFNQILRTCAEFGMTPSARGRMDVTQQPKEKVPTLREILDADYLPDAQ